MYTVGHVRLMKTELILHIREVESESSLSAWWNVESMAIQKAPSHYENIPI